MESNVERALSARALTGWRSLPLSIRLHGNVCEPSALFRFYSSLVLGDVRQGDAFVCASESS
jgi:hypothetical protein